MGVQRTVDGISNDLGSIVHTQVDFSWGYENGLWKCVRCIVFLLYRRGKNTCTIYHSRHTNCDDWNAKGFGIECTAGVTDPEPGTMPASVTCMVRVRWESDPAARASMTMMAAGCTVWHSPCTNSADSTPVCPNTPGQRQRRDAMTQTAAAFADAA